jgi:hypothetical protein
MREQQLKHKVTCVCQPARQEAAYLQQLSSSNRTRAALLYKLRNSRRDAQLLLHSP